MSRRALTPTGWLLAVVLAGWSAFALCPIIGRRLGVMNGDPWFVDSYAVLAASDAVRAGLDPFLPNPLDVYHRPHSYSRWWFYLGDLGLTRRDNFLLGGTWVALFLATSIALVRPAGRGEMALAAGTLLAPVVLLGMNRANNDLTVFILLGAGLLALRQVTPGRLAIFALMTVLATGLKFYPIVAALALLLVRPGNRMLAATGGTIAAGLAVLVWLRTDLQRAVILAPIQAYTFGAPILFRDLGWTGRGPLLAGLVLLGLAALLCHGRGWSVDLAAPAAPVAERLAFACGALLLVGCFVAGISFSYRLMFVLFLLPWLWARRETPAARVTLLLLLLTLWLDGIYCVTVNTLIGPMLESRLGHLQRTWRFFTQPVVWAAMALLAGSLVGLLPAAARTLRQPATP
ncbi:MAG TPA: hypothetical protein VHD61_05890 [Lacunisphaera sp.]|nr:hypothetical protein [Lacunisphaera sp.]